MDPEIIAAAISAAVGPPDRRLREARSQPTPVASSSRPTRPAQERAIGVLGAFPSSVPRGCLRGLSAWCDMR